MCCSIAAEAEADDRVLSTTVPTAETGTTLGSWADLMEDLMFVLTGDAACNKTESGGWLGCTARNLVE